MLAELASARQSDERTAARELIRALRDGALTFLDTDLCFKGEAPATAIRVLSAFINPRGARSKVGPHTLAYIERVFVLRVEFERVFDLLAADPKPARESSQASKTSAEAFVSEYILAEANAGREPTMHGMRAAKMQENKLGARELFDEAYRVLMTKAGHPPKQGRRPGKSAKQTANI
jgi:hypothetical protein